ncbi:MAG TPA: NAD(P)/FAD-dependent oxidoreductase [Chitinophagaceae bacterium]|nr:NAD(P)/FAD-dependent oxidoreductase [Chitinophagaceae bacterium]
MIENKNNIQPKFPLRGTGGLKVVIIGGGFGGLKLARSLNNKAGFEVYLIDKYNYHQFQPLFYQVATAGLDPSNISFPLRKVFHKSRNVHFRMAEVSEILSAENKVITNIGEFRYDILVLATGADTNFFGNQHLIENAFPMKSTVEAIQLRHRLIQNFEDALNAKDETELSGLMTIVIVGAGPTGVELSGAIADMRRFVLPKDYPELDFSKMKIYLLEGSPKTLGAMSEKSSDDSCKYLKKLNVMVVTNTVVKDYDGKVVTMQNGETINSAMVIWAAGIKGNVPAGINKELIVKGNRIKVDRFNKILGFENIYAIGDVAYMETEKYQQGHPQVASVAIQQGNLLAYNLRRMEMKSPHVAEFEYHDKGTMATVGRNLAVVDIPKPKLHLKGFLAWMMWMGLHLVLLLGVKNRFAVFGNWIYNYITYDQNLRLIFKEFYRPKKTE